MDNENTVTRISEGDLSFIEKEFAQTKRPLTISEITEKLAFQKTASQRVQDVLKYDPACRYKVGDLIYKEYNEALPVSSKHTEPLQGTVVLKVVSKAFYKNFNCEMLEVDYSGGGLFRKYIDYMKKTKTQVLIPSNCDGQALAPATINKGDDPRLTELPMADKDLKSLERNLRTAIAKSNRFFNWNDRWQLVENQVAVPEEKIKELEKDFRENGKSATTESLATKIFGTEPSHSLFDIHCLSLNFILDKKYKKEFLFVSDVGWGKWHLKSAVNAMLENLPLSAPQARMPELVGSEKPELSVIHTFPLKIYLTWREILSGGLKIPKSLNKELSRCREYTFTDTEEGKGYQVLYFPNNGFFLGLREYFESHNIPQGTSLTLERKSPNQFNFWIKKSKKKVAASKLAYDSKEDLFNGPIEEIFTYAEPNKIIFLERDTLAKLLPLTAKRSDIDLRELLDLVYKDFGQEGPDHSLHFLRAYHLVDMLKQTTQEDVEAVLLNSMEFTKDDKKKGIFNYRQPVIPVIVEKAAVPVGIPEIPIEEIATEKIPSRAEVEEEKEEELPVVPVLPPMEERTKPAAAGPAKKEKAAKKKKIKIEGEKAPRTKKSERRIIEEQIVLEESEQEALSAIKEEEIDTEGIEHRAKDKKEDVKSAVSKEISFGGIFAEKLKTALKKKEDPKQEEEKK